MSDFKASMARRQLGWRSAEQGKVDQNPCVWWTRGREVVVPLAFPFDCWTDDLWSEVADEIEQLSTRTIRRHNWANHLLARGPSVRTSHCATWSHASWVSWVKTMDSGRRWVAWLTYVRERYGYAE